MPTTLPAFIGFFLRKQLGLLIIFQCLTLAWSLDNTVWPYLLKHLIDMLNVYAADPQQIWGYLAPLLIVGVLLVVFIDGMYSLGGYVQSKLFPRFEAHVRMHMFDYLMGHSYEYFCNHFAGSLSNRISDMVTGLSQIVMMVTTLIIPALVGLLIATGVFISIHPKFGILIFGWSILHIIICLLFAERCAELSKQHADSRSSLTGKIVDSLANILNVKLFARTRAEYQQIECGQTVEQAKNTKTIQFVTKINVALNISGIIFPFAIMTWMIVSAWQQGEIAVSDVVLLFTMTWNIQQITWYVGHQLPQLFTQIGICKQAMSIISKSYDIIDKPNANALKVSQGQIDFNNVSFHYDQQQKVFESVNLTIEPGQKIGLVGSSGSGKSTFVNLIMRFYDIGSGSIAIDGQAISDVTRDSLREQIAMIPQDPTLFHRSLLENIRYGNLSATKAEVILAAKHAHCHEFILETKQGYDTLVGERGIKLSGGQRQRVAIARAILKDAPILILDEATSALDSITEKYIQDALHHLMQKRTTIVVAHRLSTLAEMDRILVFDSGKIVEDGTHESLMAANKHYAKLWHMQAGGFLPE